MPFERPPSPFIMSTQAIHTRFLAPVDSDAAACDVPSIPIIRPHTPFSFSSQSSSEPLNTERWRQRGQSRPLYHAPSRSSSSSSPSSQELRSLEPDSPIDTESPPDYNATVEKPTVLVKYQFTSTSFNTMTIVPCSEGEQTRQPKYHISVSMNPFMPLNHITTIRRGGTELGQFVAQFEMGISGSESTYILNKGSESPISSTLCKRMGSRHNGLWFWVPNTRSKKNLLLWDLRETPFTCRSIIDFGSGADDNTLATFTPTRQVKPGQPPVLAHLSVTPKGQDFFDHLLLSILIIERKRLTPGKGKTLKQLFN